MPLRKSKKRPCRICRKWFRPDPRVEDRQRTCGDHECKRKWHAKKCAEWNRKNRTYAQENYLHEKLALAVSQSDERKKPSAAGATANAPVFVSHPASFPQLPRSLIEEVIGVQQLVIIEYVGQQLFRSVQEVIKRQLVEFKKDAEQLPTVRQARGDSICRGP
ncbi:MAG: hypothetical protein PF495_14820 [Spirochaetales bacterium]|jgi:hypothetical protein|nr:hypothetical protein [Spirochaetales bacterium]